MEPNTIKEEENDNGENGALDDSVDKTDTCIKTESNNKPVQGTMISNQTYPTNQNYYNYFYQVPANNIYNPNIYNPSMYPYSYSQPPQYFNYYPFYNQMYNTNYINQDPKLMNLNPIQTSKQNIVINQANNIPKEPNTGFMFEKIGNTHKNEQNNEYTKFIKESYSLEKDLSNLEGIEFNNYLKEHQDIKKISLKNLQKISDGEFIHNYVNKFEGILPGTNYKKKFIREYVDQVLSIDLDNRFKEFIIRMREIYFKKKQVNPLKAKRRYIVGLREVEKFLRLE
jgi:hypothetical protein